MRPGFCWNCVWICTVFFLIYWDLQQDTSKLKRNKSGGKRGGGEERLANIDLMVVSPPAKERCACVPFKLFHHRIAQDLLEFTHNKGPPKACDRETRDSTACTLANSIIAWRLILTPVSSFFWKSIFRPKQASNHQRIVTMLWSPSNTTFKNKIVLSAYWKWETSISKCSIWNPWIKSLPFVA